MVIEEEKFSRRTQVGDAAGDLLQGSYELRVEVGDRLNTEFAGYRVELLAGSTTLAVDDNSRTPPNGGFVTALVV